MLILIILYFSLMQVLLSICSLLTDANPDDPLVPEIAQVLHYTLPLFPLTQLFTLLTSSFHVSV